MQQPVIVPPDRQRRAGPPQVAPPATPAAAEGSPQPNAPAQPVLPVGTILDHRYVIEGYIGGGGFAHIYRAHDRTFGLRRAVKEAFYFDDATREQFKLEAEFLQNTQHPNLVHGYAFFEQAGRLYLVMEYVDGQTLEDIAIDYIRENHRALPEAQVLDWMIPICDAVQALHSQPKPIIHRDVKPANIKLSRDKRIPILIDLGLAKLYVPGSQTIAAALAFTPGYAPPEQYRAAGLTDPRTDVYALGATLFFLLTGYQPTESPARLTTHSLPALRSLNTELSWRSERAVQRAMMLNPDERYQSAAALLADLRNARVALGDATHVEVGLLPGWLEAGSQLLPISGGPIPAQPAPSSLSHSCAQCGASSPRDARYCQTCGAEITLELPFAAFPPANGHNGQAPALEQAGQLANSRIGSEVQPVFAQPVFAQAAVLAAGQLAEVHGRVPAPSASAARAAALPQSAAPAGAPVAYRSPHRRQVGADQISGQYGGELATNADLTLHVGIVEHEAAASVTALLALIAVAFSLTGAFVPPMLLFAIVGIALAHWVLGVPWYAQLFAAPLVAQIQQRLGLARIVVPGMPMPQEFRLVALVALVVGYLWLILSIVQFFISLHLGH